MDTTTLLLLLALIFISRIISEKATKQLEQEKKAELLDLFSGSRIYSFGTLIGIIVIYFLCLRFAWLDAQYTFILYILAITVFVLVTNRLNYKKLKAHNFPEAYIKSYLISSSLRILGLVLFFLLVKL